MKTDKFLCEHTKTGRDEPAEKNGSASGSDPNLKTEIALRGLDRALTDKVTIEKLERYLSITGKALQAVKECKKDELRKDDAKDLLSMAENYYSDAIHFKSKGDYVNSLAAASYAHAWLDAGVRLKIFKVKDEHLFASD
jgi:uncharacterized protein